MITPDNLGGAETHELLQYMAKNNNQSFNFNKAIEEATEFSDALLKLQTKHPNNPKRPTREDILKEFGDFIYRGTVALMVLFPDQTLSQLDTAIDTHIAFKLNKLLGYRAENKYNNGL